MVILTRKSHRGLGNGCGWHGNLVCLDELSKAGWGLRCWINNSGCFEKRVCLDEEYGRSRGRGCCTGLVRVYYTRLGKTRAMIGGEEKGRVADAFAGNGAC